MKKVVLLCAACLGFSLIGIPIDAKETAQGQEITGEEVRSLVSQSDSPDFKSKFKETLEKELIQKGVSNPEELLSSNKPLPDFVIDIAFNIMFNTNIPLMNMNDDLIVSGDPEEGSAEWYVTSWYNHLENTSYRYINAHETYRDIRGNEVSHPIKLRSRYIDHGADKTAILYHGYRANWFDTIRQAKFFSDEGYNVLMVASRALNGSEGKYITFGYYEQDDLNQWISDEVAQTNPNQKIVLQGISMGAATTMMSQTTPHPNVFAYIEDCGYKGLVSEDAGEFVSAIFGQFNQKTEERLGFNLNQISPLNSVSKNELPKLFIIGSEDTEDNVIGTDDLFNASAGYKEKLVVEGAGHGQAFETDPELYQRTMRNFLKVALKQNISSFELPDYHTSTGLSVNELDLPTEVDTKLEDGTQVSVPVSNWEMIHYDENKAGNYTFSGTVEEVDGIDNLNNLRPTLNVITHPILKKIEILNKNMELQQGNELQINVQLTDENNQVINDDWVRNQVQYKVEFDSANTTNNHNVSVDEDGVINTDANTAVGTYKVTAYSGEVSTSTSLEVKKNQENFNLYRLYNESSGEHFYTLSNDERSNLISYGWTDEGVSWITSESGDPVWRAYNPNTGEHIYTASLAEYENLYSKNWVKEGHAFYSMNTSEGIPIYRLYNKQKASFNHHYTKSLEEKKWLIENGWYDEGIVFYGN
ncbi:Ig-like domain-containing protein [Enterococcus alishanensis]